MAGYVSGGGGVGWLAVIYGGYHCSICSLSNKTLGASNVLSYVFFVDNES